jgi:F-type H+-transporting ATPase subunit alpha
MPQLTDNLLDEVLTTTAKTVDDALAARSPDLSVTETGIVTYVSGGIARVTGLAGITAEELVLFPGGVQGIAMPYDIIYPIACDRY